MIRLMKGFAAVNDYNFNLSDNLNGITMSTGIGALNGISASTGMTVPCALKGRGLSDVTTMHIEKPAGATVLARNRLFHDLIRIN